MSETQTWSGVRTVHQFNKKRNWFFRLLPFLLGMILAVSALFAGSWKQSLEGSKSDCNGGNVLADDELVLSKFGFNQERINKGLLSGSTISTYGMIPSEKELEVIKEIQGVKTIQPYFVFESHTNIFENNQKMKFSWRDGEHPAQTFTWIIENALETTVQAPVLGCYTARPYQDQNKMDSLSLVVDQSVENGAYISEYLANAMGIGTSSLNQLNLQFEICPPICLGVTDNYATALLGNPVLVTVPVRGILPGEISGKIDRDFGMDVESDLAMIYGDIVLPYQMMESVLEENDSLKDLYGSFKAYQPISYLITLDNPASAEAVKEKLLSMQPDYILTVPTSVDHNALFWIQAAQVGIYAAYGLAYIFFAFISVYFGMKRYKGDMSAARFADCVIWGTVLDLLKIFVTAIATFCVLVTCNLWSLYQSEFYLDVETREMFWTNISDFIRGSVWRFDFTALFMPLVTFSVSMLGFPFVIRKTKKKEEVVSGEKELTD